MPGITHLLDAAASGDRHAAAELMPLVYDELRTLASARLAAEPGGQTLQPTALVHEAYLRLVGDQDLSRWESRGHFFASAAEAMRRILIENARHKKRARHGGGRRVALADHEPIAAADPTDLIDLNEALDSLAAEDEPAAGVARLHIFAGLPIEEVATVLNMSRATAYRQWTYARAYLRDAFRPADGSTPT
jgi:RNA polymerase sigma factor (TIGR02999 family)